MARQSLSIDDELLEILKKKAEANERTISGEITYRLKMSLRDEDAVEKEEEEES